MRNVDRSVRTLGPTAGNSRCTLRRTLSANGAIDPPGMLAALAAHAVPGLADTDIAAGSHTALLTLPSGPTRVVIRPRTQGVDVTAATGDPADVDVLTATVRNWLDLDTGLEPVLDVLQRDPELRTAVRARPGLRVLRAPDPFQAAILTVIGQHVSQAAARIFAGRLVHAYGAPHGDLRVFPAPAVLAALDPEDLQATVGVTHRRARTLQLLSAAVADDLDLTAGGDVLRARRQLLAVPGIGPWTVEYLAVRVLADPDAYPAGDRVLQRALDVRTAAAAGTRSEQWRPWRAYALFHLWTAAGFR